MVGANNGNYPSEKTKQPRPSKKWAAFLSDMDAHYESLKTEDEKKKQK